VEPLSKEFLATCRVDDGRLLRGESMTRIETFVDAAFAFAFTMLVISIDEIPRSPQELLELSRDIPAFVISATIIGSVWLSHATWSRTFGLQDRLTIYLSLALVMLMLIFVYPIKLVIQASVLYLSGGLLGIQLPDMTWEGVRSLFLFVAIGLITLSIIIIALYQNALQHRRELCLNDFELYFCRRMSLTWLVVLITGVVSIVLALLFEEEEIVWSAYIYFSLFITIPLADFRYGRNDPRGKQ
jgi:uncharacterized membrane protein